MTHIVKRGETLSKIAKANGITLAQLLEANPQFKAHPNDIKIGDKVTIPGEGAAPIPQPQPAPQPAPQAIPSAFARRLASIAEEQHARFQFVNEADPELCKQIEKWTKDIGGAFVSCTSPDHPWSAVFVSWCVKAAGATKSEFEFSKAHSVFVHKAIQNALNGTGVFHGLEITAHAPRVGDIIQHNRGGTKFNFAHARKNKHYKSHSVIVVEVGQDAQGPFAFCIGGNERDAIRRSVVRLTSQGLIRQRNGNPFICVIKTLK